MLPLFSRATESHVTYINPSSTIPTEICVSSQSPPPPQKTNFANLGHTFDLSAQELIKTKNMS